MKRQERKYGVGIFQMVGIDLSHDHLTGGIQEEITSLSGILNLNLSWNQLSGLIPEKIGAMKSMESLDLSWNNLSGEIPPSLSELTYLSYMDLSHNNLTGRIPQGRQLDTLYTENPSMYDGNSGLCGPPLQRNCSGNIAPEKMNQNTSERDPNQLFFYLGLGSGYIAGLWVVFCALLFLKVWRIAYFRLSDKIYDKVYVYMIVIWGRLARRPVQTWSSHVRALSLRSAQAAGTQPPSQPFAPHNLSAPSSLRAPAVGHRRRHPPRLPCSLAATIGSRDAFASSRFPREIPSRCCPDHRSEDDEDGGERAVMKGLLDGGSCSGPGRSSHDKARRWRTRAGEDGSGDALLPCRFGNARCRRGERTAQHMDPVVALLLPAAAPQIRAPASSSALLPGSAPLVPLRRCRTCFVSAFAGLRQPSSSSSAAGPCFFSAFAGHW
ncbi:hypothetical protein EJB05_57910, partial [Eragrostis curvula]